MKLTIQITPDATMEYDVPDAKEAIKAMGFWQSLPKSCPKCHTPTPVRFDFVKTEKYDYYLLVCAGDPRHESALGAHSQGGTLFYKNGWKESIRGRRHDHGDEEQEQPMHPRGASEKESLMGEIRQLAPLKQTTELKIANGMSGEREQKLEGLTTEQLRQALEILKKK